MIKKYGNCPVFDNSHHFGYVIGWLSNIRHYSRTQTLATNANEIYPNSCNDAEIIATTNKADTRPSNNSVLSKLANNNQGYVPVLVTDITNNHRLAAETLWMGWGMIKMDFLSKNTDVERAFLNKSRNANSEYRGCTSFVESLICDFGFNVIKFPEYIKAIIIPPLFNGNPCVSDYDVEPSVYSDYYHIKDILTTGYENNVKIETVPEVIIWHASELCKNDYDFSEDDFRQGFIKGFNA